MSTYEPAPDALGRRLHRATALVAARKLGGRTAQSAAAARRLMDRDRFQIFMAEPVGDGLGRTLRSSILG